MEMEGYIAEQETLLKLIRNSITNYNKIAKAKRFEGVIRSRISILQGYWDKFLHMHVKISTIATADDSKRAYFKDDAFEETEAYYLTAMDHLQEELEAEIAAVAVVSNANSTMAPPGSPSATPHHSNVPDVSEFARLPVIEIPKFSGNYTDWSNFKDIFETAVSHNTRLSNVQKLHYLKTSLTGEAYHLLKNVTVTDANYAAAWQSLTNQYENKRAIINAHLRAFYAIPVVSQNTLVDLKTLRDQANDVLTALKNLGRSTDSWDDLIVFHLVDKLDKLSRQLWETHLGDNVNYPSYEELKTFLNTRIRALEAINFATASQGESDNNSKSVKSKQVKSHHTSTSQRCNFCADSHSPYQCDTFRAKSVAERLEAAREKRCCFNCLRQGHLPRECRSKSTCSLCHRRHHTLLHENKKKNVPNVVSNVPTNNHDLGQVTGDYSRTQSSNSNTLVPNAHGNFVNPLNTQTAEPRSYATHHCAKSNTNVLLATAWVQIKSKSGRLTRVRALLDQGSEASFITESVAQTLRAPRQRISASVSGLGGKQTMTARSIADIEIKPCQGTGPSISTQAIVLQQLTSYRPSEVKAENWAHLQGITLADSYASSEPINLLIGADLYGSILLNGLRKGLPTEPIAQNTIFGWVLSGPTQLRTRRTIHVNTLHCAVLQDLNRTMTQFWEDEAIPQTQVKFLTEDEIKCDKHFTDTHSRPAGDQYMVRLPFRSDPPIDIGDSYSMAMSSYCKLEKRLATKPEQKAGYDAFLEEYLQLGHMTLSKPGELTNKQCVYLTHHPVIREESSTTKLRVVFNGSLPTTNGTSLNDHLLIGPKLQADIVAIILQWRVHPYVIAADIAKMFRQILVDERDRSYQLILWRRKPEDPVNTYKLNTVTYGTGPSPYLANRVIKQLVEDEGQKFPLAVPILLNNIYVDDVLFGADDIVLARQKREQTTSLLELGKFQLRKFAANLPRLIDDLDASSHNLASDKLFHEDEQLKMLGIYWTPLRDEFRYKLNIPESGNLTKRTVLSIIAKIYYPLGWISPFVITAKVFMQRLWHAKLEWNDPLPNDLAERWLDFFSQLTQLDKVAIPRWVGIDHSALRCELHGFADASNVAYGAVVYIRIEKISSPTDVAMLLAKTKVAPLKTLSIPRLELMAAVMLAKLVKSVQSMLNLTNTPVYCWTDSTVALAWIKKHPSNWKTFVANRVAEIQTRCPTAAWHHVPTDFNPADCASRGIPVSELVNKKLWWNGPQWLGLTEERWPKLGSEIYDTEVERKVDTVVHFAEIEPEWDLPYRFSSWSKLLRVTAYLFRFIESCRRKLANKPDLALSNAEIQNAKTLWIKRVQQEHYKKEILDLANSKKLSSKTSLVSLNPVLDAVGIMRVGGRLRNAPIAYESQSPIILPKHQISSLRIADCHKIMMHAGTQLMLRVLRQKYWIMRARDLVKSYIHKCVTCTRDRALTCKQQMGDLPKIRVTPARPFDHSGVDYAGPLLVRYQTGRGQKSHKAYLAIFVCLSTRAIHLEVVSNYSTNAFLAAFRRFAGRRGTPSIMYSDNGTNFRGADRELQLAFRQATEDVDLRNVLASDGTEWHFIPPNAPHFGGLWEAGVKSVKLHLRKIIGAHTPTSEELTTLSTQIKACLNSRPITPLNDDPENFDALTPGHFSVGGPLEVPPEPSLLNLTENRLSRWQLMSQKLEKYWKIWTTEYLQSLQKRVKWSSTQENLKLGDLVLIKNSMLPPTKWQW